MYAGKAQHSPLVAETGILRLKLTLDGLGLSPTA